jgi:hypothetical protein
MTCYGKSVSLRREVIRSHRNLYTSRPEYKTRQHRTSISSKSTVLTGSHSPRSTAALWFFSTEKLFLSSQYRDCSRCDEGYRRRDLVQLPLRTAVCFCARLPHGLCRHRHPQAQHYQGSRSLPPTCGATSSPTSAPSPAALPLI